MLESLGVKIKQAFLVKRRKFEMIAKTSINTINKKIEQVWKMQQKQGRIFISNMLSSFCLCFEWDTDMQKLQEQEEKLDVGVSLRFKIS